MGEIEKAEKLASQIIGVAIDIHKELGPAYTEKIYQRALYLELKKLKVPFVREKEVKVVYKGVNLGKQVVDFIVGDCLLLELKKVDEIKDVHKAQVLSYLKATGLHLGLLLNFGGGKLEIKRVIV